MRKKLILLTIVAGLAVPSTISAQSLGQVAAAEAARRKAQKAPTKVYTNDTLAGTQDSDISPAPAPSDADKTAAAKSPASSGTTTGGAAKPEQVDEKKTEAYWRGRVTALQQSLARNKILMQAMQSRINALNAEALAADDPGRHAAAQANLTTAVNELERLKQESDKQDKDLLALQEEARRANIPPGWLR
jgi:hypothetical protein